MGLGNIGVGVVAITPDAGDASAVVAAADNACYEAKQHGRPQGVDGGDEKDADCGRDHHRGGQELPYGQSKAMAEKLLKV